MNRRRRADRAPATAVAPLARPAAWKAPAASALAALLVWLPSLKGAFVYDDIPMVVNNPVLRDPANLTALLAFDPARFLLTLSWVASHALGGFEPWAFRLPNIALHAVTSALVASLAGWLATVRGSRAATREALVAGLFFAITPMATETVAYVASRSTGLSACFGFAFLAVGVRELGASRPWRRATAWLLLLLAHASKEEAAALPLLLLLLDLYGPAAGRPAAVLARWRVHVPFLLVPLAGLLGRRLVLGEWLPAPAWPRDQWLHTQALEFPGYLLRALLPLDPAFHRGVRPAAWPPDAPGLAAALVVAVIGALVLRWPRGRASLAVAWMAVALLPSSSLVPLREMVVDHRAYVGGFGAAFAVAGVLALPGRGPLAAALGVVLCVRTLAAQHEVGTAERAWTAAVARAPESAEAHLGLGLARMAAGRATEARIEFEAATRLAPHDGRAWSNLATALQAEGRVDRAASALELALKLLPGDGRLHFNMGVLRAGQGHWEAAERSFAQAADATPPLPQAMLNAASLMLRRGDLDAAGSMLERAAGQRLGEHSRRQWERLRAALAARRSSVPERDLRQPEAVPPQ